MAVQYTLPQEMAEPILGPLKLIDKSLAQDTVLSSW